MPDIIRRELEGYLSVKHITAANSDDTFAITSGRGLQKLSLKCSIEGYRFVLDI